RRRIAWREGVSRRVLPLTGGGEGDVEAAPLFATPPQSPAQARDSGIPSTLQKEVTIDEARRKKKAEIARHYHVRGRFLFLHVNLLDNRSEFSAPLEVTLRREGEDYVAEVNGAIAIANTIAYLSEAIDPISIFLGLTRRDLMGQAVRYLLFGEGETGLMVYTILLHYWELTPEDDVRPLIFLMSD